MSVIVTLLLVASIAINMWLLKRTADPRKQSTRSTLIQGIKNVKELTTLRQHFQSVVIFKDSKELFGLSLPGTGRKFILKYGGVITCGNDLENIQITERFAVNRVRMIVPCSKILDLYADMKSVQVYDQRAGLFTSIELSDQNREIAGNLEEVRQDAIDSDILRRADENTRIVLTSLAVSLGMEAEVIFDDRDAGAVQAVPVAVDSELIMLEAFDQTALVAVGVEPMAEDPESEAAGEAAIMNHLKGDGEASCKSENISES